MQWWYRPWPRLLALGLLAGAPGASAAQDALVLGGGGSRGLAHVGAIQGLARKGFRPELVVGTSMGAIMGALYATGLSADSIWSLARAIDWQETFAFPTLRVLPSGEAARPFLQLGIGVDRRRYTEGLVPDRHVNRLLVRQLFDAGARAGGDFDNLPIRFRAIASDLRAGVAVSLGSGDLARAVRASMAVPGVFAPVIDEAGRYLVDGGITDYLPVAAARDAGGRRVVAVDVIRPPPSNLGRMNPFQIALRAFRLTLRNARPDGPAPAAAIEPVIDPDLSAAIFLRDATPLLEAGLDAALRQFPDSLAAANASAGARPMPPPPARFASVQAASNDPALTPLVEAAFAPLAGTAYRPDAVLAAADRLHAAGYFDAVWPHLEPGGRLVVEAVAQPPLLAAAALEWDDDRGPRAFAALRGRVGAAEAMLAGRLGGLESRLHLLLRRPITGRPDVAPMIAAGYEETDVRLFDGRRILRETDVRRWGGWAGIVAQDPGGRGELIAAFRADRIERDGAAPARVAGWVLRMAGREPNARIVGSPPVLELEQRRGDLEWFSVRTRGSLATGGPGLRAALVADLTAVDGPAPLDALPALGEADGMPGFRWGRGRGPVRAIGGLDVAVPAPIEGFARLRIRAGAVASEFGDLGAARWTAGAEMGLLWWTPFGRIAAAVGATRDGDWRASLELGPRL